MKNQMSLEEKARVITNQVGGDYHECLDWLSDGDGDVMRLDELVQEWREIGATYQA